MSLETKIMDALKDAMRSKNEAALRALRSIKSAILLAKTEEGASPDGLTEDQELKIVQKMAKQRKDSLEIFEKQGREDLAVDERNELAVINQFLPEQMSEERVKEIIEKIKNDNGFTNPSEMGKLMPLTMKELQGKADGKLISSLVKQVLESK